ncbi:hypothetical protein OH77DRAFT_1095623 [Trametes cingulata]|nr:hypothetical protein OH77DRAFT_1095623 [Trametes cingulata]
MKATCACLAGSAKAFYSWTQIPVWPGAWPSAPDPISQSLSASNRASPLFPRQSLSPSFPGIPHSFPARLGPAVTFPVGPTLSVFRADATVSAFEDAELPPSVRLSVIPPPLLMRACRRYVDRRPALPPLHSAPPFGAARRRPASRGPPCHLSLCSASVGIRAAARHADALQRRLAAQSRPCPRPPPSARARTYRIAHRASDLRRPRGYSCRRTVRPIVRTNL